MPRARLTHPLHPPSGARPGPAGEWKRPHHSQRVWAIRSTPICLPNCQRSAGAQWPLSLIILNSARFCSPFSQDPRSESGNDSGRADCRGFDGILNGRRRRDTVRPGSPDPAVQLDRRSPGRALAAPRRPPVARVARSTWPGATNGFDCRDFGRGPAHNRSIRNGFDCRDFGRGPGRGGSEWVRPLRYRARARP